MNGSIEEAIPSQERAIRLSPRDPKIWQDYYWIGQVHLLQSRIDEAILWFEKARTSNPEHTLPHAYLAPPTASKARPDRLPPNSPASATWPAMIDIRASPV